MEFIDDSALNYTQDEQRCTMDATLGFGNTKLDNNTFFFSAQDQDAYELGCKTRCMSCTQGASINNRVRTAFAYGYYLTIPGSGQDAILYFFIALLLGGLLAGNWRWISPKVKETMKPFQYIPHTIMVMILGALLALLTFYVNLKELSNSCAWWINMNPPELLLFALLPVLLFDAAMRINWFHFRKALVAIMIFAFAIVILNTILTAVFMQYAIAPLAGIFFSELNDWNWYHGLTLGAILGSTDPVAVIAFMEQNNAPAALATIIEGESLFNDASAYILFQSFLINAMDGIADKSVGEIIGDMFYAGTVGLVVGLIGGMMLVFILKSLHEQRTLESIFTLIFAYLTFYVAQRVVNASGPVAVTVCGLFMSASGLSSVSPRAREHVLSFWDVATFASNVLIFFYSGSLLFTIFNYDFNAFNDNDPDTDNNVWLAVCIGWPLLYLAQFLFRGIWIAMFHPLLKKLGHKITFGSACFLNFSALRGGVNLVMASIVGKTASIHPPGVSLSIIAWVAGFVLLTLLINAPLIPLLMKVTNLTHTSSIQVRMYGKAKKALHTFTLDAIKQLERDSSLYSADIPRILKVIEEILDMPPKETIENMIRHSVDGPMDVSIFKANKHDEEDYEILTTEPLISANIDENGYHIWYFYEEMSLENNLARKSYEVIGGAKKLPSADPLTEYSLLISRVRGAGINTLVSEELKNAAPISLSTVAEENSTSLRSELSKTTSKNTNPRPSRRNTGGLNTSRSKYVERFFDEFKFFPSKASKHALGASVSPHFQTGRTLVDDEEERKYLRLKFIVGIKRNCRHQRLRGRISPIELNWIEEACDRASDDEGKTLEMWPFLESKLWVGKLRKQNSFLNYLSSNTTTNFFYPLISWYYRRNSKVACTSALSYLDAIKSVGRHKWIKIYPWLHHEVQCERKLVEDFLHQVQLSDPQLIQAVQTYRATRSLATMMISFAEKLEDSGLIDEHETDTLIKPIEETLRYHTLYFDYKPVLNKEILKGFVFCSHLSTRLFVKYVLKRTKQVFLKRGEEVPYTIEGKKGIYILFQGVVQVEFNVDPVKVTNRSMASQRRKFKSLIGSGATLGCRSVLTGGQTLHEKASAYSSTVCLGFISEKSINQIRKQSPNAERDLFRCGAAQVIDNVLRTTITDTDTSSIFVESDLNYEDEAQVGADLFRSELFRSDSRIHEDGEDNSIEVHINSEDEGSPITKQDTIGSSDKDFIEDDIERKCFEKLERESLKSPFSYRNDRIDDIHDIEPLTPENSPEGTKNVRIEEKDEERELALLLLNNLDYSDIVILSKGDSIMHQGHIVSLGGTLCIRDESDDKIREDCYSGTGIIAYSTRRRLIAMEKCWLIAFYPFIRL